jgi:hypothetical protein
VRSHRLRNRIIRTPDAAMTMIMMAAALIESLALRCSSSQPYATTAEAFLTDCFAGASAIKMRITGALTGGQLLPCSTSTHTRR